MAEEYPTFAAPVVVEDQRSSVAQFSETAYFDYETGDIAVDGAGKVVIASGQEAWLQWCTKQLMTERMEFYGYTKNIGVEFDRARAQGSKKARETAIARTIKEALMADPAKRTKDVRNFRFAWADDAATVTFEVWGADGYTGELTAVV